MYRPKKITCNTITTVSRTASYCSVNGNQPPWDCGSRKPPHPIRSLSRDHPRFLSAWSIHWWDAEGEEHHPEDVGAGEHRLAPRDLLPDRPTLAVRDHHQRQQDRADEGNDEGLVDTGPFENIDSDHRVRCILSWNVCVGSWVGLRGRGEQRHRGAIGRSRGIAGRSRDCSGRRVLDEVWHVSLVTVSGCAQVHRGPVRGRSGPDPCRDDRPMDFHRPTAVHLSSPQ
jgi:hypothetical protein